MHSLGVSSALGYTTTGESDVHIMLLPVFPAAATSATLARRSYLMAFSSSVSVGKCVRDILLKTSFDFVAVVEVDSASVPVMSLVLVMPI
jgi:hypothetical protein